MAFWTLTGSNLAKTVVAGVVLASASAGVAHAVPSYGYASLGFTNFTLGGVIGAPGVTVNSTSVTMTDGSNYPGFAPAGTSTGGSITTGADVPQATSGPGPFPGQNIFGQALLPAASLTPAGTRGDAVITGALAGGATSNLVAEGKLSVPGGFAGSNSGTSTTLNLGFRATTAGTVTLTFNASSMVQAIVGTDGDSANAQLSSTFQIFDTTTGKLVTITDNINPANSSTTIAPFALNRNAATTSASSPQTFTSASTFYSYSAPLVSGDSYQITLQDSTTIILSTATPSTVPEPASLGIIGAGILGIGLFRARRNKKS
jgi:hypothetical protein